MSETKNAALDKAKAACPGHIGFDRKCATKDSRNRGAAVPLPALAAERSREQLAPSAVSRLLTSIGLCLQVPEAMLRHSGEGVRTRPSRNGRASEGWQRSMAPDSGAWHDSGALW